jgi:hypothetical protein
MRRKIQKLKFIFENLTDLMKVLELEKVENSSEGIETSYKPKRYRLVRDFELGGQK